MPGVTIDDIRRARERLDDPSVVKRTPVEESRSLSDRVDADVHLKMEHLQWTGSFKTRGAYNTIRQLADAGEVDRVVAASAGNHAQGVALAASTVGIDSTIVMPRTAPQTKVEATAGYGAEVELHGATFQEAMSYAQGLVDEGAAFVHAYDDPDVVAGQGTLGLEIHEQVPDVDTVFVPIGGGGLIGGIATALAAVSPETRVVGVQAEAAATVPQSLRKGSPQSIDAPDTMADGIATGGVSELTFELIRAHVDEVVTVDEGAIANAILLLLERAKQVVEGAGAISVAAMLESDVDVSGETVVPLLCGGNLDMTMLEEVIDHVLVSRQRLVRLRVRIEDRPGTMHEISEAIGEESANIRSVQHRRAIEDLNVGEAFLEFRIETGGADQTRRVIEAIEAIDYPVERLP